ncbi:arginine--tRNA ligase [Candidatus Micrarchaeota archaeon]|nr:arginine--tRNA ligase [Candidatus Micrarchaeota archaeon]
MILMYALQKIRNDVSSSIKCSETELSKPPENNGDISCSAAFRLAKEQKKNPKQIADELAKLKKPAMIKDVRSAGPYVNFFIDYEKFAESVLEESLKKDYGSSKYGEKRVITIDYSSPNIAKPFGIGHLRSTVIGQSIYNLNSFVGFKCVGINHLGDWGLQFGKLLVAYKKWGDKKKIEKDPIRELLKIYVRFHEEAKKNPDLEGEALTEFRKLEEKDHENTDLWRWFSKISLRDFNKVYAMLGISFDKIEGEAHYALLDDTKKVVDEAIKKKVAITEEDGAIVIPLEKYNLTNARLFENGRTLYITRDVAAAEDRKKKYKFSKNIYVVGSEQKLHFQQLFKTIELLGYEWSRDCEHVPFGMMSFPEGGKMSTREGKVIFLEDVLDKAVSKAKKIISEKNPSLKNKDKAAGVIGVGAVKFADLSQNRIKDVEFDWDRMISFEGDTAPYLQYAYVRCLSILEKTGKQKKTFGVPSALEEEEKKMIIKLAEFPDVVMQAAVHYEPHVLANYLLSLVHDYSAFYEKCKVIGSSNEAFRLKIVESTANVLKIGLGLLGIGVIDEM